MRPRNAMRAILSLLAASCLAVAGEEAPAGAFTDVTADSTVGVGEGQEGDDP